MTAIPTRTHCALSLLTCAGPTEEGPAQSRNGEHAMDTSASEHPRPTRTKHTHECLVERLKQLELSLFRCFPAYAAECGLVAAERAGLNYIRRTEAGDACDLDNGAVYLRVVAYRAARRRLKREPRTVLLQYATLATQDKHEEQADEHKAASDQFAELYTALASLPSRQWEALRLRILENLSLREIAREMGVAPQTVSLYVMRALARLRQTLSEMS